MDEQSRVDTEFSNVPVTLRQHRLANNIPSTETVPVSVQVDAVALQDNPTYGNPVTEQNCTSLICVKSVFTTTHPKMLKEQQKMTTLGNTQRTIYILIINQHDRKTGPVQLFIRKLEEQKSVMNESATLYMPAKCCGNT
ncbi:Hypothetical_protein [Hexamita inflata]|uniref:Hypothetical_protein n=1 Tax=Hexamita inflata TaxID=28002 RepID=A0AA86Q7M9_9EUKA|nr:Hypothetical protein HINF_LOCUS35287 [Hexamita inflata]